MNTCKTVELLRRMATEETGLRRSGALAALNLIDELRTNGLDAIYLGYLHEIIEHVYDDNGLSLLAHLNDGPDCDLCVALAGRLNK